MSRCRPMRRYQRACCLSLSLEAAYLYLPFGVYASGSEIFQFARGGESRLSSHIFSLCRSRVRCRPTRPIFYSRAREFPSVTHPPRVHLLNLVSSLLRSFPLAFSRVPPYLARAPQSRRVGGTCFRVLFSENSFPGPYQARASVNAISSD